MITHIEKVIPQEKCESFVTTRHTNLDQTISAQNLNAAAKIEMDQVHGNNIQVVTKHTSSPIPKTDALITTDRNTLLVIRTADCLPILIFHNNVIAAIHAGRKSTENNIFKNTLQILKTTFKATSGLHIYFGPHICETEYEINPNTHEHYSLRKKNLTQLLEIYTESSFTLYEAKTCTKKNIQTFYSYRQEKESAGRFYSCILRR